MTFFQRSSNQHSQQQRFSDGELVKMREKFDNLSNRFDAHEASETKKFNDMISAVNKNTESINKLAGETVEIVKLYRDLQGATRVGKRVQDFLFWLTKWGTLGAILGGVIIWVKKHVP